MVASKFLSIILAVAVFLSPTISYADYSWQGVQDWAAQLFNANKESAEKFMPFALFSMGMAVIAGLFYWTSKNGITKQAINGYQAKVELKRFDVYSQNNVGGGGVASCGYQTLLRAMQVVKSKSENEDEATLQENLNDQAPIALYFGMPAKEEDAVGWRKEIIKFRKSKALKNDLDARLLPAFRQECDGKTKDLYKSALGFLEEVVIARAKDPVKRDKPYDFSDHGIMQDLVKSLDSLKNKDNEVLIEKLKTPEEMMKCFDFKTMRENCLSENFILELRKIIETINQSSNLQDDFRGEWLNDAELEYIWEYHKSDIIPVGVNAGLKVISNFDLVGDPEPGRDEVRYYIDEKIVPLKNRRQQIFQIFAMGNMKQYGDKEGTRGHWTSLIMHQNKEGKRHYYMTDSLNRIGLDNPDVWKIINMIESVHNYEPVVSKKLPEYLYYDAK